MNPVHEFATRSLVQHAVVIFGLQMSLISGVLQAGEAHTKATPAKELAQQLQAIFPGRNGWKIHEVDEQPSVRVKDHHGFRLVLRRTWKHYTDPPQQQARPSAKPRPFELRHTDWEFVLFPLQPKKAPAELMSQIPWQKSKSRWHTRNVWMGEGHGYTWFTHSTIFDQEWVREKLSLEGGDDRIQLAVDGLMVEDLGTMTGDSCLSIPAKFGNRSLPYIRKAIERTKEDNPWRVVGSLVHIRSQESTELLLNLYNSDSDRLRSAAGSALIRKPYRKEAKRAYLDMILRQSSLRGAANACVEFGWKDALPILQGVIAKPRMFGHFREAIYARRTLEGNPIAQEIRDAERTLYATGRPNPDPTTEKKLESARHLLIHSEDSEAANLAAISLSIYGGGKGGRDKVLLVRETGIEILKSRPQQSTITFLKSLVNGLQKPDRQELEAILHEIDPES